MEVAGYGAGRGGTKQDQWLFISGWHVLEHSRKKALMKVFLCVDFLLVSVATSWGVKSIELKQEQGLFLSDTVGFSLVP